MATRALGRLPQLVRAGGLLLLLPLASEVEAQTFPLAPAQETGFALQWERPFFPGADGLSALSSNFEADALFRLGSGHTIQVGFPLAIAGADAVDGTSVYLGNLRASLLFGAPDALSGYLGLTLPTAGNIAGPDLAVIVGVLPWLDELEKWSEDAYSLRGAWIPSRPLANGGQIGLRLGGAAVTPNDFENLFVYARAAGWVTVPAGTTNLRADLATSYHVDGDNGFGQQFMAYLNLGASLSEASGHPGLFIRIPLDRDARDAMDFSIGVSARF